MKCEVCDQYRNNGKEYTFFTGITGPTDRQKIGIKTYQETTVHQGMGKTKGWVCRLCYLRNLLTTEKMIVVVLITGTISLFDGPFLNNFLIGLFFSGVALGGWWMGSLAFFWTQHGDRALIKKYKKNPEFEHLTLYHRAEAFKFGWIKDNEVKI